MAGRAALALLSGALVILSFPPTDAGPLAFVALVPVLLACRGASRRAALGLGLAFAVVASVGVFLWIFRVKGFGALQALVLGPYFYVFGTVWCLLLPRLWRDPRVLLAGAPAAWTALDFLRAHAGFLSFPWATLAQSQHANLAGLQIASVAGEPGVTFLVALANAALALLVAGTGRRAALLALAAVLSAHGAGAWVLGRPLPGPRLSLAAVQPCLTPEERASEPGREASLERLARLTRSAVQAARPDLVAWPETSVPGAPEGSPLAARLVKIAAETGTPLLVGAADREKFRKEVPGGAPAVDTRVTNAAHLYTPDGESGPPYRKMLLVPFAEYRPLEPAFRWPTWVVPHLFDVTPGTERRLFRLGDGTPFSVLICWESLFAPFVRRDVAGGAALLVHITNDHWFGRTAASRQHNLASILRAVENRVPVLLSSNAGPSLVIDARGRVVGSGPGVFEEGFSAGGVALAPGGTFYTRVGDSFAWGCVAAALLCLAVPVRRGAGRVSPLSW